MWLLARTVFRGVRWGSWHTCRTANSGYQVLRQYLLVGVEPADRMSIVAGACNSLLIVQPGKSFVDPSTTPQRVSVGEVG
jgi:hypothetical protein